jgi:hypothetical protein
MTRTDLGFVVSRAMAVWVLAMAGTAVPLLATFQDAPPRERLLVYGMVGLWVGLAAVLWTAADRFAPAPTESSTPPAAELRLAALFAVGLLLLAIGATSLLGDTLRYMAIPEGMRSPRVALVPPPNLWGDGVRIVGGGVLLYLGLRRPSVSSLAATPEEP